MPARLDLAGVTALTEIATSAPDRYAFYLAGLARMGLGETAPALAVTNALGGDLADGTLSGASSGGFSVTGGSQATVPAVPAGLSATATSATQIQLNWSAAVGAASYNIYRSTSAGVVTSAVNLVNTSAVVPTAFADSGLATSTTYFYTITSLNSLGESVGSTEVSASTLSANALVWRNATASPQLVGYDRAYYLNGNFMTLHFPGVVSSSADGATRTTSQTGTNHSLKELAFGNGRFVSAGSLGALITTP
jgi:hypothetical protein